MDVVYGHKDGLALTLDVHRPARPNGAGIISIVSGGWQSSVEMAQISSQLQFLYVGPLSPRETVPKAEAATRRALRLDDTLALAHQTLASILHNYHWQWEDGDKGLRRARALQKQPAEPSTMELIQSGQFALAIAQAERARRLDPLSFQAAVNLASAFRAAKQYDRAIAEYRSALEITPRRPRGHFQLGVTFVFSDRLKEAIDELETAVRWS